MDEEQRVVVFEEKHDPRYFLYTDDAHLKRIMYHMIVERWDGGDSVWYTDTQSIATVEYIIGIPEDNWEEKYKRVYIFMQHRQIAEYEGWHTARVEHVE